MPIVHINSIDDPRLADYRELKERELARDGGKFIAESEHVVRRLLASDYEVQSVLVARRRSEEFSAIVRDDVPLLVVADEMVHRIVGFKFHSGVLACGRRKALSTLQQITAGKKGRKSTIVICPELASHDNLGSLIRIASAFGVDGMVLGPKCCDAFYRHCIRVSMGTIFSLPMVRSEDLIGDMRWLRENGFELLGTVLSEGAESLKGVSRGDRLGIVFGNEAQGIDAQTLGACDRRVTIPMRDGVDSLNVAVAAGIFLYEFCG
jgi:tRNA G18 (ribose-2'-O)-methylase SpoU